MMSPLLALMKTTWGALVDPPITLIAQPTEEIGRTATELLFQRIEEPTRSPKTLILRDIDRARFERAPFVLNFPHRRKPQPIRTHMRADDRGHIDHQNITRHRLAGFLHEVIQKFSGARFCTGV